MERKIDHLGRVVIPMEFRKKLGIEFDSTVTISLSNDEIIIKSQNMLCALCGNRIDNEKKLRLCNNCISKAKSEL